VDDPLRVALGELARQRPTRRIHLAALSADAVRVLASGSDLEPAALYRLTGANPFYVTHREAAAQLQRALRFAAAAGDTVRAGLYDDLAIELSLLDRAAEAAEASQRALELWRAAGDRRRKGDAMRRLSCTLWHLCRGEEAEAIAEQAVAVLGSLPPGVELAQAYVNLATQHTVKGRHHSAIEHARRAQSIAAQAGAPAVISEALNTEATSAAILGLEWTPLMDRALQLALAGGLHGEAGRAYCNYYATCCSQRKFADAEPLYADGTAYCDEHDVTSFGTFLRSEHTGMLEKTGRWDEALALSREILERAAPAPVTRLCPLNRIGTILGRRGDPQAWSYLDEAIASAEGTGEPSRSCRSGSAAPRPAGWKEGRPTRPARPSWPMTSRIPTTAGCTARWPPGCAGPDPPAGAGGPGRALPSPGQRPLGEGRPAVDRPGLSVRGRAGPPRRAGRGRAAGSADHLHRPGRAGRGAARPAAAARSASGPSRSAPGPRPGMTRSGSPGASGRSSGRSASARPTRRSPRSCSSRPRPSTTTCPRCWPSSAHRTATPPPPRPPSWAWFPDGAASRGRG